MTKLETILKTKNNIVLVQKGKTNAAILHL